MVRSSVVLVAVAAALVFGACEATTLPASAGPSVPASSASAAPGASTVPVASEEPSAAPGTSTAPATTAPTTKPATTAPTTKPAATATPVPTAAPADASAAFVKTMGDPLFTANVAISGITSVGSVTTATTGTLDIHAPSSHLALTSKTGRTSSTTEVVNASGSRYLKQYGQFFDAGAAKPENLLTTVLSVDGDVSDLGVETVGGQDLHHLSIAPPTTLAAALLLAGKGISNVAGTVDAWVEEDGTPVLMRLAGTWDQASGKKTVAGTQSHDLTFTNVGSPVTVAAPESVWRWANSRKFGYRMAYPSDWQFEKATKKYIDAYWGYDGDVVFAERFKSYGLSLNQVVTIITKNANLSKALKGIKVTSNKPGRLGSLPARIVQYNGKLKKVRYYYVAYIAVKGSQVYWVELRTDKKTTADDKALAADFAATHKVK